jgi:hypothetical protein
LIEVELEAVGVCEHCAQLHLCARRYTRSLTPAVCRRCAIRSR